MPSSFNLRSSRNNRGPQQPIAVSAAVVILALTALVCAGLVAVPLWTALVRDWQVDAISDRCGLKTQAVRQEVWKSSSSENHNIRPKGPTRRSGFILENRRMTSRATELSESFEQTFCGRRNSSSKWPICDLYIVLIQKRPSNPYALMNTSGMWIERSGAAW
jgi:hypothetical protein